MKSEDKTKAIIGSTSWVNFNGKSVGSTEKGSALNSFATTESSYNGNSKNFDKKVAQADLQKLETAANAISTIDLEQKVENVRRFAQIAQADKTHNNVQNFTDAKTEFENLAENLALKCHYLAAQVIILEKMIQQSSDKNNQQSHLKKQVEAVKSLENILNMMTKFYDKFPNTLAVKNLAQHYVDVQKIIQTIKQFTYDETLKSSKNTAPTQPSEGTLGKLPEAVAKYLNSNSLSASVTEQNNRLQTLIKAPFLSNLNQQKI